MSYDYTTMIEGFKSQFPSCSMLTLFHDKKVLKSCQICFTLPSPISESLTNNAWYTNQKNIIWTSVKFYMVPIKPYCDLRDRLQANLLTIPPNPNL